MRPRTSVGVVVLIASLLALSLVFDATITGRVVSFQEMVIADVNLLVTEDATYSLSFDEPVRLTSVRISGVVIGNGSVSVSLGEGTVYEKGVVSPPAITGAVVADVGENETPEPFNSLENQTINVSLSYIPNAFDPDSDGVADLADAVDMQINADFSFVPDPAKLCTLFEVYENDSGSTFACQGNASCCAFAGVSSSSGDWDVYYSYYGKDGAGRDNIVQAQVIHYDVSLETLIGNIVQSNPAHLPVQFAEVTQIIDACVDTCQMDVSGTDFMFSFAVVGATLHVHEIGYTYSSRY